MKKILLLLLAIAGAGGYYYWKSHKQVDTKQAPKIATTTANRGAIALMVSTIGRVVANFDVEIKCKASGQVIKLPYDISEQVRKGKLLVELDPSDEERRVEQARVSLLSSQAKLAQAKENLKIAERRLTIEKKRAQSTLKSAQAQYQEANARANRLQQLIKDRLASQEQYDTAIANAIQAKANLENAHIRMAELQVDKLTLNVKKQDVTLAQAQVDSNQISLSLAKQSLSDTKVFAPIDGVVATRDVQIGQIISSGISNVGGGTTVLTLSDLSRLFVLASVDESDIGKVKVDQRAIVTTDAFPEKKFRGKVVRIATRGISSSNVVTFEVKIEVMGPHKLLLKPEMTANIEIIAAHKDNVLLVQADSVYRKSKADVFRKIGSHPRKFSQQSAKSSTGKEKRDKEQDYRNAWQEFALFAQHQARHFVHLMNADGTTEKRDVVVGIDDGVNMEIVQGLKEGDRVVINSEVAQSRWRREMSALRAGRMMMGRRKRR